VQYTQQVRAPEKIENTNVKFGVFTHFPRMLAVVKIPLAKENTSALTPRRRLGDALRTPLKPWLSVTMTNYWWKGMNTHFFGSLGGGGGGANLLQLSPHIRQLIGPGFSLFSWQASY
jgi:hypothetical protein